MLKLSATEALALVDRLPPAAREAVEAAMTDSGRGSKYGNRFVIVDGTLFHSEGEYKRWCDLRIEARAGSIKKLSRQEPFKVTLYGELMFTWYADFVYWRDGARVVEDFKGFLTPIYKLKKKIIEALYGFRIFESRARRRAPRRRSK